MVLRFDFVKPLLHLGLDPLVEDWAEAPAFARNINDGSESQMMALHQLSLSQGVYDNVVVGRQKDAWVAWRMLQSAQVFDSMVANVLPDFYRWPMEKRLDILLRRSFYVGLDYKTVNRLIRPRGGFHPGDLQLRSSKGESILQWMAKQYFQARIDTFSWFNPYYEAQGGCVDLLSLRLFICEMVAASEYSDVDPTYDGPRTTATVGTMVRLAERAISHRPKCIGRWYDRKRHRIGVRHL